MLYNKIYYCYTLVMVDFTAVISYLHFNKILLFENNFFKAAKYIF